MKKDVHFNIRLHCICVRMCEIVRIFCVTSFIGFQSLKVNILFLSTSLSTSTDTLNELFLIPQILRDANIDH